MFREKSAEKKKKENFPRRKLEELKERAPLSHDIGWAA